MKIEPDKRHFPADFVEWAAETGLRHRSFQCERISEFNYIIRFRPPCRSRMNTTPVGSSCFLSPHQLDEGNWRDELAKRIKGLRRHVRLQLPGPRLAQRPTGARRYPKIGKKRPL